MKRPNHRVAICVRRDHILWRSWRCIFCVKSGRMSGMLVSNIFHHEVMSDDIDDIQNPRYHVSRRTLFQPVRGFAGAWMAPRARSASPWGRPTLKPQSTCHGGRPGPTLAPWCCSERPACHGAESTREDPRLEEKKMSKYQKNTFIHGNMM